METENAAAVSVLLPCYNEEETIGICIAKALEVLSKNSIAGEVIVVDNGSTDRSAHVAREAGARVVKQDVKGYGAAYLKGFEAARGNILIMGDADNTYDFLEMPKLIDELQKGSDLVLGSRFMGEIKKGAMSFSHRYIGNPILTTMLNVFFGSALSDCHSGFRALRKETAARLNLHTTGMEFASEMIAVALREKLAIREVPITYYPRQGSSKLESFSDAWRHIRFLLLYSPDWLYFFPGVVLFLGGVAALVLSGQGKLTVIGHRFDVHAMIFFTLFSILGFQILNIGVFAKKYARDAGFIRDDIFMDLLEKALTLERVIGIAFVLFVAGAAGALLILIQWLASGMGSLNEVTICLVCLLLMAISVQLVFTFFFLSLLMIPRKQ